MAELVSVLFIFLGVLVALLHPIVATKKVRNKNVSIIFLIRDTSFQYSNITP